MTGAEFDGVDIDLLADYIGGALAGTPDEPVVAALIADDPAWRTAYESLGGGMAFVGAELGRLEAEPMPADLAAKLDTMFRAAPAPLTLVHNDDETSAPARASAPRRSGRRMRWAAPFAVAAGLIGFAGFSLDYFVGSDNSSQSDTAAESAADTAPNAALSAPDLLVLATGTDYTESTLAVPPPQPMLAAESGAAAPKDQPNRAASGDRAEPLLGRLTVRAALDRCLDAIKQANAAGDISVESVDYARFDGNPALVVRFTAANGQWAWASGPGCGTPGRDADTLGKVPVR